MAEDGQIEAVSVIGAKSFAVGVQWHPEYRYWENPQYNALLQAFHDAAKAYQAKSLSGGKRPWRWPEARSAPKW